MRTLAAKSYTTSFFIHGGFVIIYLMFLHNTNMHKTSATVHSMQVSLIELKEQVKNVIPPTPEAIVPPVPIVKPKPVAKPKPKPVVKKVVQEPTFIKEEIVAEVVPTTEVSEVLEDTLVVEQVSSLSLADFDSVAANIGAQHTEFVNTNFEIIRQMVLRNLRYPNGARQRGQTGTVEVSLVIDTSGKLLEYFISTPSNFQILNNAALQAVKRVENASFPAPKQKTTIILPVVFNLK